MSVGKVDPKPTPAAFFAGARACLGCGGTFSGGDTHMCEAREKPPVFVIENMATGAWQRQWETGETGSGITNVRDLTTEATRMVVLRAPVGPVAYNEED